MEKVPRATPGTSAKQRERCAAEGYVMTRDRKRKVCDELTSVSRSGVALWEKPQISTDHTQ